MSEFAQAQSQNRPPDFGELSALVRNIVLILGAAVSFSLWLSSTITTPKRIDKLEESMSAISDKQAAIEEKTNLISDDVKELKVLITARKNK